MTRIMFCTKHRKLTVSSSEAGVAWAFDAKLKRFSQLGVKPEVHFLHACQLAANRHKELHVTLWKRTEETCPTVDL